ncbi:SET domain-containing protein SmydA-8-like isoform X2 [Cylas formicarius]|uniref:SET domain-containing protein SmydA-8-like isoform X2 n=1 Tax=Cylas formicarius TaxID=197179 RepID=UPI00295883C2|nr:SET domain-containing protein SmydA-8-like isoform X2 [Cylas formicarius]
MRQLFDNFELCKDDNIGRHLVATKDIKSGDIILQEPPLIWGPAQVTVPICLGCGKAIDPENYECCSKCGWPVCSKICEQSPSHIPECQYTVSRGSKVTISTFGTVHPSYQCITALRCLYQKQFLSNIWKKLDLLESHCEQRKSTPKYQNERITVAQFILRFFKLKKIFTEEDIMRICGIIMVNAHEVPLTSPPYVAIYETSSMFEHSCSANCTKTFTDQGSIVIKAGTHIKKGEHLSICYTDPLWGTANRRYHLHESKFFWCICARCSDPTEFGTFFSALKCQKSDCNGFLLPRSFLDHDNNDKGPDWFCNQCNQLLSAYCVNDILEHIGQELMEMKKGDSISCKHFITMYEPHLHSNHYYLTDVKLVLSQIIGHELDEGLPACPEDDLTLKARTSQELSHLMVALVPGETKIRGLVLFQLHVVISERGRRHMGSQQFIYFVQESKKILEESLDLLRHEPKALPEGIIYQHAEENLKQIDSLLRTLGETSV